MAVELSLTFAGAAPLRAALLPEAAPRSVAALAAFLAAPREATALHAMYDGPEIMVPLAPDPAFAEAIRALPAENATCFPSPGDVVWFRFPPHAMPGQTEELWEIAVAYAPGVRLFGAQGWSAATVFARLRPDDLPALAAIGRGIRREGVRAVTFQTVG